MTKKTKSTTSSRKVDPVTKYAKDVVSGKELAGPYVRAACQRHLDDLKTGAKRGLHFFVEEVEEAIRFFELVLKVEGDGEYIPFELHPSQAFIVGSLFGWWREIKSKGKGESTWRRRFRTAYVEQGKGNGKSPLSAGLAIKLVFADGEIGAQGYVAGRDKEQSNIAFQDAVKMWQQSPQLMKRVEPSGRKPVWQLTHVPSGSFLKPLSKNGAPSGPRPNVAIIDEYHEHKTADVLEMLEAGFKKRPNPLLFIITNSGSDKGSPCGKMHDFAKKVALGEYEPEDQLAADNVFTYICALDEGDDPFRDKKCWKKANPLLGVTIQDDFLESQVATARAMPSKQNKILRLHFCQWTDANDAWITRDLWERCESPDLQWEKYRGKKCYLAIDLAFTRDLAALAAAFPTEDGVDVLVKFWKPEENLSTAIEEDKVRYDLWAKDGFITLTPGPVIRLEPVAREIGSCLDMFDVQAFAYDRYRLKELADDLADLNILPPLIEHPQGFRRGLTPNPNDIRQKIENPLWMPNSCQELENSILENRIRFEVNPCLRWNVGGAVRRINPAGTDDWIFDKRRALGRIDGIVASAMAVGAVKHLGDWTPPSSPWDDPEFSLLKQGA